MALPDLTVFYVENPTHSTALYCQILQAKPLQVAEGFVLFVLDNGHKVGLWARSAASPALQGSGGSELAFTVSSRAEVDAAYVQWQGLEAGPVILSPPQEVGFGYTFCALDPDGHCLRVYCGKQAA
jgi:hypothetical protein